MEKEKSFFNFWLILELFINFFVVITIVPIVSKFTPVWLGVSTWIIFMIWGFKPLIFAIKDCRKI